MDCTRERIGTIISRILARRLFLTLVTVFQAGFLCVQGAAADDLLVPGGYAGLLAAVGITASVPDQRVLPLIIELSYSGPEGLRVTRLLRSYADSLERQPPSADRTARAPLPLGTGWWTAQTRGTADRTLIWDILTRRDLASLYYALHTMDPATVAETASNAALTRVLLKHARLLPSHARGIRIASGRVAPAGGDPLAGAWESLVGARLDDPVAFIDRLCAHDGGRLLHFYKTIAALNPVQVRFLAGDVSAESRGRRDRLAQLAAAFSTALGRQANDQALLHADGVASVLFSLDVRPDGRLAGPSTREFWRRAWDDGEWEVPRGEELVSAREMTPADVIGWLCGSAGCNQTRVETFLFLQRTFPSVEAAEAPALLAVAWTRRRFPALALEIERMRLDDPAVYFELGHIATNLDRLEGMNRALATIQFQGAVATLARMRLVGAPRELVRGWAHDLTAIPLNSTGYEGRLVGWLFDRVLIPREGEDADTAIVRHLSGGEYQGPGERLEWEGLHYRVDVPSTEGNRLRAARTRFPSSSLRVARQLAQGSAASATAQFARPRDRAVVHWMGRPQELPAIRTGSSKAYGRAADVLGADALAGLVYALALNDTENSVMASPELPRRQILFGIDENQQPVSPWSLAEERRTARGRVVIGSLLGLDVSVPSLAGRRLSMGRPADQATLSPEFASGLQRGAALTSVWTAASLVDGPLAGTSMSPCFFVRPRADRWTRLGLRREPQTAVDWIHEPLRRAVDELSRRKMPLVLVPGVLRLLVSDLVESANVAHPNDVVGVMERLGEISPSRFDDYIAAIAARGPLVAQDRAQQELR